MKRNSGSLLSGIALICLTILAGCDNGSETVDTSAPTIELEDPAFGESFSAGNSVHFEAAFTDDIELGAYKIDIHNNFDGHSHGRIAKSTEDPALIKWSFSQSFDFDAGLKNSDVHLHDELEIPLNTMAGPYHFILSAVDRSGNATSYQDNSTKEVEIYLTNGSMPAVDITNLSNDELEIEVGQTFMVTGNVTDPTDGQYAGMHAIEIVLGEGHEGEHDHDHGGRLAEEDLIDFDLDEEALEPFMADGAIVLDLIFEEINFSLTQQQLSELIAEEVDHLQLMIKVYDEQGNIAVSITEVHVHMD
ncbi:MAG: DUF4625 domain-containing protein [Cyclobacteriaceae bacterium]|nr:DUF4625 domain-containing protein [Cyclobacteriaceae bacterium]